jgi:hypothetical protein
MDNRRQTTPYQLSGVRLCNTPTVMVQLLSLDMIRGGLMVSWTFVVWVLPTVVAVRNLERRDMMWLYC